MREGPGRMLEFNPDGHVYTYNGTVVPSCTQILNEFLTIGIVYISTFTGARILAECMESARDFGTAVHKMIALDIAGELDEDALDPKLAAVLMQWHRVCCMVRPEILLSETPLYCSAHHFAGTADLILKIKGVLSIIDLKTGLYGSAGAQVAAYEVLAREHLKTRAKFDRYVLHLPKNGGDFKLVKLSNPNDWGFFLSRLYQWKYLRGKG
jgi:hypothetical protein